jgi:hypothetical protein
MGAYWSWLANQLKLTVGGRIAVTAVLAVSVLAGCAGVVLAFVNVESGDDPEAALGFQIVFALIAAALCAGILVAVVTALDAGFRGLRSSLRRFRSI